MATQLAACCCIRRWGPRGRCPAVVQHACQFNPSAALAGARNNGTCASALPQVKPKQGDALLFFNTHVNGSIDKHSLHGGCPVVAGTKWAMTKW